MKIAAYKLNAFTQTPEGGNPAGVIIGAEKLNEMQMQQLAGMIGFSETAFIMPSDKADFKVRFFTPNSEVDLCGHATIAAFSLLLQKGLLHAAEYTQETKAGILRIKISDGTIYMEQTLPRFYEIIASEKLLDCLNIDRNDLEDKLPIQVASTGLKDILVPLKSEKALKNLRPDMNKIEAVSKSFDAVGLHVFALSEGTEKTAVCRNFAPLYGIPEESATGTSNGALACYLHKYGVFTGDKEAAVIRQGIYMNRPSLIKARLAISNNAIKEVWVGGEAVFTEENIYQI